MHRVQHRKREERQALGYQSTMLEQKGRQGLIFQCVGTNKVDLCVLFPCSSIPPGHQSHSRIQNQTRYALLLGALSPGGTGQITPLLAEQLEGISSYLARHNLPRCQAQLAVAGSRARQELHESSRRNTARQARNHPKQTQLVPALSWGSVSLAGGKLHRQPLLLLQDGGAH